jgi:hypothetical protein
VPCQARMVSIFVDNSTTLIKMNHEERVPSEFLRHNGLRHPAVSAAGCA